MSVFKLPPTPAALTGFASFFTLVFTLISPLICIYFSSLSFTEQVLYLLQHNTDLNQVDGKTRVMLSLLLCRVPTQIEFDSTAFRNIIESYVGVARAANEQRLKILGDDPPWLQLYKNCTAVDVRTMKQLWPLKPNTAAMSKAGIFPHDILMCKDSHHGQIINQVVPLLVHTRGLYADQVASLLLYVVSAGNKIGVLPAFWLGMLGVVSQDAAKSLSVGIKALGWNATLHGACVCELNVLTGRIADAYDFTDEIKRRTGQEGHVTAVALDDNMLRRAVHTVITSELDVARYKTQRRHKDSWFNKRWLTLANGAHSRFETKGATAFPQGYKYGARMHRKAFSEQITFEQYERWDGVVHVTPSVKREHGKNRALFSCDSLSMMHFSELMDDVERCWRNIDCIIDPGRVGTIGMGALLHNMKRDYPFALMADYDDFNSQHTLQAQAIVIDELTKIIDYDYARAQKLVNSFNLMQIHHNDTSVNVTGTLMSGHRCTTFINTVLNCAYMQMAHDIAGVYKVGKHVGDDIVLAYVHAEEALAVLGAAEALGLRLNRSKQSFGKYGLEFLRVAYDNHGNAFGYVARAIASFVSGNWTNETELGNGEVINNAITSVYTICNRADDFSLYRFFIYAVARRSQLSIDVVRDLLSGNSGINGSPNWKAFGNYSGYTLVRERKYLRTIVSNYASNHRNATHDYMKQCLTDVERAFVATGTMDVEMHMLDTSYYKDMVSAGAEYSDIVTCVNKRTHAMSQRIMYSRSMAFNKRSNIILDEHPILQMLVRFATAKQLREIARQLGIELKQNWRQQLSTTKGGYNVFTPGLPYTDMCMLSNSVANTQVWLPKFRYCV